jgi:heme-degrading monooxygenase HmoA
MIAVIFHVLPHKDQRQSYLEAASALLPLLEQVDGFISVERFQSLGNPDRLLSLSFWRDERAIQQWRNLESHRKVQEFGRAQAFRDYRLRVAEVKRDYGMASREQAPVDSRRRHDQLLE